MYTIYYFNINMIDNIDIDINMSSGAAFNVTLQIL